MAFENEPPELGRLHDTSILWRVSAWGGAATIALAAAMLITQTDIGAERLRLVFAPEAAPIRPIVQAEIAPRAANKNADAQRLETQRLETQVRQLAADRDRLTARIASLEQNLEDMTGSIKRERAMAAATAPPPQSPPPTVGTPQTAPPQTTTPQTNFTTVTAGADNPSYGRRSQASFESKVEHQIEPRPESQTETKLETKPEPLAPIDAAPARSQMPPRAAGPLTEPVPMPPVRVAAAPAGEPAADPQRKGELGVDLGGARTVEILNARWLAVKANFGPMLEGMHPLMVHDRRPGLIPYRLIVGPLPNGAAAANVCARFAASRVTCRTTRFVGEQLVQQ